MSHAVLARASKSAPVAKSKASSPSAADGLRIGEPNDAFEQEADLVADRVMNGEKKTFGWSLSQMGRESFLQRKCSCGLGSNEGECAECKKKETAVQRKSTGDSSPSVAPPIVHEVLRSPGQPLDSATRAYFEPRFGHDFSRVRVHTDSQAAESARSVGALAYTVADHVVFAAGQHRPQSNAGRNLMAHELAHTIQQTGSPRFFSTQRVVQRKSEPDDHPEWDPIFDAIDNRQWEVVARLANKLDPGRLKILLQMPDFKDPQWVAELYHGAVSTVGEHSAVANATRYTYLDFNYEGSVRRGNWSMAAQFLNGFNQTDIERRLAKLNTEQVKSLYDGALANQSVGIDSGTAKFSAKELSDRSGKGDATAKIPTASGAKSTEEARKRCEAGDKSGLKIFPLRMPHGMWRVSVAPISAQRQGNEIVVKQPVNGVFGDPMFHNEVKTLPLETFLGGIHLQPQEIVGVKLYDDNNRIACVTGEDMLKLSHASDTAVILSIARTAVDAATIFVPGAGAGLSKGAQLAIGAGVGGITAGVANISEQYPLVDAGLKDHIDWGQLGFDVTFGALIGGLLGPLSEKVSGLLEGNGIVGPVIRKTPGFVKAFIVDRGMVALQFSANQLYNHLRKEHPEDLTFNQFIDQLAKQLTDPSSLFMGAVSSAIASTHESSGQPTTDAPPSGGGGKPPPPTKKPAAPTRTPRTKASAEQTTTASKGQTSGGKGADVIPIERGRQIRAARGAEVEHGAIEQQQSQQLAATGTDSPVPVGQTSDISDNAPRAMAAGKRSGAGSPSPAKTGKAPSTGTSTPAKGGRTGGTMRGAKPIPTAADAAALQYRDNLVKRFPDLSAAELKPIKRNTGEPGLWEESVFTGSGKRSWSAKLRNGESIQIDDIDPSGVVVDTKMRGIDVGRETPPERTPDVAEQIGAPRASRDHETFPESEQKKLLRQLRFARENGLTGVRWETNSPEMKQAVERYVSTTLTNQERKMVTIELVQR